MSVESHHQGHEGARPLRSEEQALLRTLLENRNDFQMLKNQIASDFVIDLLDGGMKSLKFVGDESRSLGALLAEAEYVDVDGVVVSIVVNADQGGQLFEVDIWKVDFSPLKQYPRPEALSIKR
ncbi:DUF6984 family protein [Janthinobacterium aestuarii]